MPQFTGKTVLITGALGTVGRSMVARYAEEGASVIALDRPDAKDPQAILDGIVKGVRYFGCDLNDLAGTEKAVTALADEVGGIDILVNDVAFVVNKPHEDVSILEKAGKIINMTSLTLTGHWEGFVPYVASKGAMYGLVKAMARELGVHGINVNGINPGAIVSEAEWRHFGDRREKYHQWILENQSLKRRIEPVDIANTAIFLSSSQADLITGQDIHVDGGW